jgi:hypothetical protein
MSAISESAKLSDLIQAATKEIVERTEEWIHSAKNAPAGPDTVSFMMNGEKFALSRESYKQLKAQNDATKSKLRAEVKALLADQVKTEIKKKPGK